MNKALLGILAAALVSAGKSTSKKGFSGSFGLKKNKEYDRFKVWVDNYISKAKEETREYFKLNKTVKVLMRPNMLPEYSLEEAIDLVRKHDENDSSLSKQESEIDIDDFVKFPINCPEAYAYSSLLLGLSASGSFSTSSGNMSNIPELMQNVNVTFWYDYISGIRNLHSEMDYIKNFYTNFLEEITDIRKTTGYTDQIQTEDIVKENLKFFSKRLNSWQPALFQRINQNGVIFTDVGILPAGIAGYTTVKYLETIVSLIFDKNLSNMMKDYYSVLTAKNRIGVGKHPSYNVPLLVINKITVPTKIPFSMSTFNKKYYFNIFSAKEYNGMIISRIYNKISKKLDQNTLDLMEEFFTIKENRMADSFRDSIRRVVSPRQNELNMDDFCDEILYDLMSLYDEGISLQESRYVYRDLENLRDQQVDENYEPFEMYWEIDNILSGDRDILDYVEFDGQIDKGEIEDYLKTVQSYSEYFLESKSGSIDTAFAYFLNEQLEAYENATSTVSEIFRIGEESISIDSRDNVLLQMPVNLDNPEGVIKVILVEYKNPSTLTGITDTTNMCVGKDDMHYKAYLKTGSHRHFGILAKKADGTLYVMYHTHVAGGEIFKFTNVKNTQEEIVNFPSRHHHILETARNKIAEVIR